MGLFDFMKKKEEKASSCCRGNESQTEKISECCCDSAESMEKSTCCCSNNMSGKIQNVKVLGAGCKSCHEQYENVKKAVESLGLAIETEYITDMAKVMEYGVMSMPAIVINGQVAVMGKVLKVAEVEALLRKMEDSENG